MFDIFFEMKYALTLLLGPIFCKIVDRFPKHKPCQQILIWVEKQNVVGIFENDVLIVREVKEGGSLVVITKKYG